MSLCFCVRPSRKGVSLWWSSKKKVWMYHHANNTFYSNDSKINILFWTKQKIKRYNFRWLPSICYTFIFEMSVSFACMRMWVFDIRESMKRSRMSQTVKTATETCSSVEIEFNLFWECIFQWPFLMCESKQSKNCYFVSNHVEEQRPFSNNKKTRVYFQQKPSRIWNWLPCGCNDIGAHACVLDP